MSHLQLKKARPALTLTLLCLLMPALLSACQSDSALRREKNVELTETREFRDEEGRTDPQKDLERTIKYIQEDDTTSLLSCIYPASLDRFGKAQIVERNAKIHADLGVKEIHYEQITPLDASSGGNQRFYTADARYLTRYGELKKKVTLSFIWHPAAESWQLDWTPAIILPGLKEQGQVHVESLKARRGEIYDRSGWPLAVNRSFVQVNLVPRNFDAERASDVETLLGLSAGTVETKLSQSWVREDTLVPIALLPDLRKIDYAQFQNLGLSWQEVQLRDYPFDESMAQLIGYVSRVSAEDLEKDENAELEETELIGRCGLEQVYDARLRGKNGCRVYVGGDYEQTLLEVPAEDGENLQLTLDALAQRAIYEELKNYNATVTAVDPLSGEILALVSTPSYKAMDFVLGISNDAYAALLNDPRQVLQGKYALSYTPGSTQKILTSIIALSQGLITPEEKLFIQGKTWQLDDSWGDYAVTRYHELDQNFSLADAITYSDNIFFARLACKLGASSFNRGMRALGIGDNPCRDYPFRPSQIANAGEIGEKQSVLLADSGYGQGEILLSPLQLTSIYAAVLNQGKLMDLRLLISNENNCKRVLLSPESCEVLKKAMERVVEENYTKQLKKENFRIAGKSGTAELGLDEKGEMGIDSWFIGYNADHPAYVMSLTLFHSEKEEDLLAMKLFGDILENLERQAPYQVPEIQAAVHHATEEIPAYRPLHHQSDE